MDTALLIASYSEAGNFKTTCSTNCGGIKDAHGECCNISGKNSIIGPVPDAKEVIERLQVKFPGINYKDVFIDFEEAKNLFPDKEVCQDPWNFPAYRTIKGRCIFYKNKGCSIQQEKSLRCKTYACEYLRKTSSLPRSYPSGVPIMEEVFRGVKEDLWDIE